jgi:F0F1-type ATP synthase membrane subunit a
LIAATAALIPFSLIILLEIAVSLIQSYVFAVLLVSYIEGAL